MGRALPADQEKLIDDQLRTRKDNARKLFYKIYDNGYTLFVQGQAAEIDTAPEGKTVPNKLKSTVNGYRYELASLCRPMDQDAVSDAFGATLRTVGEQYPACRGVDLTPFNDWFNAAQDAYLADDYAAMRYRLMKASVVAKQLIREGANNPLRVKEGEE